MHRNTLKLTKRFYGPFHGVAARTRLPGLAIPSQRFFSEQLKDVVIEEIESILLEHSSVRECAVFGQAKNTTAVIVSKDYRKPKTPEEIRTFFETYDADDNGSIDQQEFLCLAYDTLKSKFGDIQDVVNLFHELDADQNGVLEFDEFCVFYERYFQRDEVDLARVLGEHCSLRLDKLNQPVKYHFLEALPSKQELQAMMTES